MAQEVRPQIVATIEQHQAEAAALAPLYVVAVLAAAGTPSHRTPPHQSERPSRLTAQVSHQNSCLTGL